MTLLPIVERELRVAARNPLTYRARLSMALTGAGLFVIFAVSSRHGMPPHMIGQQLCFLSFGILFMMCLFGGCQLTADSISSEKREGTLGFLFLTNLRGHDIVLGKLASSSLGAIYGGLGLLPLVSVMFLFGGVSGAAMLRLTLASLNVLFLSLSVGLAVSCLGKEANRTRGWAFLGMAGFAIAGPLVGWTWSWLNNYPPNFRGMDYWGSFCVTSPVMAFAMGLDSVYQQSANWFWLSNGAVMLMGMGVLGLAMWLAPRTWQERAGTKRQFGFKEWWRKVVFGNSNSMATSRARMLDINAVHWLISRERFKRAMPWAGLSGMVLAWFILRVSVGRSWFTWESVAVFYFLTNSIFCAAVALESAKQLAADRESGALELLLCTAISVPEILRGQWLSIQRVFLKPLLVISAMEITLFFVLLELQPRMPKVIGALMLSGGLIVFWVTYLVMPWVGMWKAMVAKVGKNAGAEAVVTLLVQPWVITYLLNLAVSLVVLYFTRSEFESFGFMAVSCFFLSLAWSWLWYRHARRGLMAEFRVIAMNRYASSEQVTVWGWLGKGLGVLVVRFKRKRRVNQSA